VGNDALMPKKDTRGCNKHGEEGKSDDNKPIVVDIPTLPFKCGVGDLPTIRKKPHRPVVYHPT